MAGRCCRSSYCTKQIEGLLNYGMKRMKMSNTLTHAGYTTQAERNLKAPSKCQIDFAGDPR